MAKAEPKIPKRRTMYDRGPVGRTREVLEDDVKKWQSAGWFLTPSDEETEPESELSVISDTVKSAASASAGNKPSRCK